MDSNAAIVLGVSLSIIMMGMGLSLTIDDFKRIGKYPLAIFIGFVNQIILLPLIAYLLVLFFEVDVVVAMGILILAACPGGATSNLVTHLAKGDTALSVSLTALNSLITIVTIPLIVNFGLSEFMGDAEQINAPIAKITASLVIIIAIPLALGMIIKHYYNTLALKMDKPVRIASAVILGLVIIGLMIKEQEHIAQYFAKSWRIALSVNVITMTVGFFSARIFRLNFKQSLSISIESGSQNGTLAIHVAVVSLARPDFAIVAVVYSLLMYLTAIVPIVIGNRKR